MSNNNHLWQYWCNKDYPAANAQGIIPLISHLSLIKINCLIAVEMKGTNKSVKVLYKRFYLKAHKTGNPRSKKKATGKLW